MDILEGILKAGLLVIFLIAVIAAIAVLFMVVFGIAAGIDEKIQN